MLCVIVKQPKRNGTEVWRISKAYSREVYAEKFAAKFLPAEPMTSPRRVNNTGMTWLYYLKIYGSVFYNPKQLTVSYLVVAPFPSVALKNGQARMAAVTRR